MKAFKVICFFLLLMGIETALAETDTESGAMLLEDCQATLTANPSPTMDIKMGMCMGRVSAVRDLLRTINSVDTTLPATSPFKACISKDVTTGDAIRVVVGTLAPHPEKLSLRATALILYALTKGYPCTSQPQ